MTQQGRLAGTRGPDQRHHFTGLDGQRQIKQRLFAAERLVQVLDPDHCVHGLPPFMSGYTAAGSRLLV